MSVRLPNEHGAWGMLAVPLVCAVAVAGVPSWDALLRLLLVTVAVLGLFLLRASLEAARRWRAIFEPAHLLLSAATLLAGGLLVLAYRQLELLALASVAGILYLLQHRLATQHRSNRLSAQEGERYLEKRSLLAELVGVVVLTLSAPAAWIAVRGALTATAAELWALNLLFFLGGVLYVKYRVRGLQAHRDFAALRQRLGFAWPVFLYHLALAAFLLCWVALESRNAALLLAFTPGILRASQLAFQLGERFPIRRLGWTEVLHSAVFAALLVLAFRMGA